MVSIAHTTEPRIDEGGVLGHDESGDVLLLQSLQLEERIKATSVQFFPHTSHKCDPKLHFEETLVFADVFWGKISETTSESLFATDQKQSADIHSKFNDLSILVYSQEHVILLPTTFKNVKEVIFVKVWACIEVNPL